MGDEIGMICNKDDRIGNYIQHIGWEFPKLAGTCITITASGTILRYTTRFGRCVLILRRILETEREGTD
jgi:hypothetical protein